MANSENSAARAQVADTAGQPERFITYAEAAGLIREALASLRIYVVESDITEAQNSVRAIVEQASF